MDPGIHFASIWHLTFADVTPVGLSVHFRQFFAELPVKSTRGTRRKQRRLRLAPGEWENEVVLVEKGVQSSVVREALSTLIDAQPSSFVECITMEGSLLLKKMVYKMEEIKVDTLDVFAMRNQYKAPGYEKIVECWWSVPSRPLQIGRRVLNTNNELLELIFYAQRNGNKIHLYEHTVSVSDLVEDCSNLIEMIPTPTQIQTEAPTIIDLESSPQKDISMKTTPPTQTHVTPTQNSNSKTANNDTTNPTRSNINYAKPTNSKPNNKPNSAKSINIKLAKPTAKSNLVKPQTRSATRVSSRETKKVVQTAINRDDESISSDSYDSVEDNLYIPRADELSSDDEDEDEIRITQVRKKDSNRKRGDAMDLKKAREEIMLEDDGLVVDSDSDVELGLVFGKDANVAGEHEEYDAYDGDSNGKDSLQMKIPLNSEDEANVVDDAHLCLRKGSWRDET
ncbi:hypothetical protein PIB30_085956 [Stylosanthes scabra]|uniref:PB1-like domain-containing protein n=1 Tax=Stylosanthes scabra TaxID=79078 RepID=A0ABU6ST92_9FABA|nr:hypothetical protein [Stylosanthes scabra]